MEKTRSALRSSLHFFKTGGKHKIKEEKEAKITDDENEITGASLRDLQRELLANLKKANELKEKVDNRKLILNNMRIAYEESKAHQPWYRYGKLKEIVRECIAESRRLASYEEENAPNKPAKLTGIAEKAAVFSDAVKELSAIQEAKKGVAQTDDRITDLGVESYSLKGKDAMTVRKDLMKVKSEVRKSESFLRDFTKRLEELEQSYDTGKSVCNLFSRYNHLKSMIKTMCYPISQASARRDPL